MSVPTCTEAHAALRGPSARSAGPELRDFFAALATKLRAQGVHPFIERVHGPADCRQRVLDARRDGYAQAGCDEPGPVSYLHGRLNDALEAIGVQLWSIGAAPSAHGPDVTAPRAAEGDPQLHDVRAAGAVGRLLEAPDRRLLWLSCVDGRDEQGRLEPDPAAQARRMFARARSALGAFGFEYPQVARTWIALRGILDWYGPFNAVRSAFHAAHGIGAPGAHRAAPASTGVEGASNGEQCVMDLLAVEPRRGTPAVDLIAGSRMQGDARAYGSSFSRAALLPGADGGTLLVSGTASIGLDGQSLHGGDPEAQAQHTLRAVGALLGAHGAGWRDVVGGTLYVGEREALHAFQRAASQICAAPLPLVPVLADLCRPELLVEMDAIVQVPADARALEEADAPGEPSPRARPHRAAARGGP